MVIQQISTWIRQERKKNSFYICVFLKHGLCFVINFFGGGKTKKQNKKNAR